MLKKLKLKKTNEKAITLIALIITIIVLLILAGITISTLSGPNGILKNTQKAKEETIESTYLEIIETTMQGENISIRANIGNNIIPDKILFMLIFLSLLYLFSF